jgi:hypothetical protein
MTMPVTDPAAFFDLVSRVLASGTFVKATMSRPWKSAPAGLRQLLLRPVVIRGATMIAWTWRHERRDEVRNLTPEESLAKLRDVCGTQFRNADVFTSGHEATLTHNRRGEPAVFIRNAAREIPARNCRRMRTSPIWAAAKAI